MSRWSMRGVVHPDQNSSWAEGKKTKKEREMRGEKRKKKRKKKKKGRKERKGKDRKKRKERKGEEERSLVSTGLLPL